jgi:hypothetical protein
MDVALPGSERRRSRCTLMGFPDNGCADPNGSRGSFLPTLFILS